MERPEPSERSGGSLLGDKTRMVKLSTDPNAFIRPMPNGLVLGGIARQTRETMLVCEAAGYDIIVIETVGVGQSEVRVAEMTDFLLVLMQAGAGDELQGIKRGLLELADLIAIAKADGGNVIPAKLAASKYAYASLAKLAQIWPIRESFVVWPSVAINDADAAIFAETIFASLQTVFPRQ